MPIDECNQCEVQNPPNVSQGTLLYTGFNLT